MQAIAIIELVKENEAHNVQEKQGWEVMSSQAKTLAFTTILPLVL